MVGKMNFTSRIMALSGAAAAVTAGASAQEAAQKPNVVYIMCDDMGDGFDGLSFLAELKGEELAKHDHLYWEFHETDQIGVRRGDWKLVVKSGKPELYNLADDIHENHNIAAEHPEIVKELVDIVRMEHRNSELFPITLPY